jgi:DNA repair exonuclease SbcCD nuclease subunit
MGFRFIHAADIHLGCPFVGIKDSNVSARLMDATYASFQRVIDICIEKQVDFLLIAGDIYDAKDRSLRAQLQFRKGLERLAAAEIDTYIVHGNHDPDNGLSVGLEYPSNVHIFSHGKPKTMQVKRDGNLIASICGWSYPKEAVQENTALQFKPDTQAPFNIALLHCNCGSSTEYENYAPCTPAELLNSNFDYWALGHIHKRNVLSEKKPWIVYPGNPQGLNPKETGQKGCYLVEVGDDRLAHLDFIAAESVQWNAEDISVVDIVREDDLLQSICSRMDSLRQQAGKPVLVRFTLTGRTPLFRKLAGDNYLNDMVTELQEDECEKESFVWVESIRNVTKPAINLEERRNASDFAGDFLQLVEMYRKDDKMREELLKSLAPLFQDRRGRKWLTQPDDAQILDWLENAESIGLDKLITEGRD